MAHRSAIISEQAKSEQAFDLFENEINNFIIEMDATQRDLNRSPANNSGAVEEEKNTGRRMKFITGPFSNKITSTQPAAKNKSKKLALETFLNLKSGTPPE